MSNVLSALNPSAAAAARSAARESGASDKAGNKDKAGTPFSELMGAGAAETRTGGSEAKASKLAKADKPERPDKVDTSDKPAKSNRSEARGDDEDGDDDRAARPADATPALPAWLQALREPPVAPPPAGGNADAALTTDDGAAALAAVAGSLGGSPELKTEVGAVAAASPTPVDAAASGFGPALALAADADGAATAKPEPLLLATDSPLTAAQNSALGNALDQLASKTDLPTSLVAAVSSERGTVAVTSATPPPVDTSLSTAQPPVLDAFGEPLALDGPDSAVRLGERLRWLSEAGVQEARMQLHPKELGSIDVRIRVEHQTATVWFGADHPAARAALESTLPQLRERLAADGLQLGQAQVGTQAQSQGQSQGGRQGANGEGQAGAPAWGQMINGRGDEQVAATPASERLAAAVARHRGLVDRYA